MEYKFAPGQRLLLELQTELLEGDYESGSKNRIDLVNITDRITNLKVKDKLSFYRSEIVEISCLDDLGNIQSEQEDTTVLVTKLSQKEKESLAELSLNFIYIDQPNDAYKQAVARLQAAENIGVVGLTGKSREIAQIKLLVVSVSEQIYMFDIYVWKGFPLEISEILESNSIWKLVHNSQLLKACLRNCHKVELNHIFDTQVADAMVYEKETSTKLDQFRSLAECLLERLCLSSELLEQIENVDAETWETRPLNYTQVTQASFLVTYLLPLKNHFQQIMLKKFHKAVRLSSNSLKHLSFFHSHTALSCEKIPGEVKAYLENEKESYM